jgi:hypothetical protein
MPDKRYTKLEEEVLEILDRLEHEAPAPSRPNLRLVSSQAPKRRRRPSISRPKFQLRTAPPWIWLASAFGLAILAILVRDTTATGALVIAVLSLVCFFAPLFVRRSSSAPWEGPPGTKTWRGRDITLGPSGDTPVDRTRRWLDSRRGRGTDRWR